MARACEILVVDDEPIACKRLRTALESNGYAVETANSGSSALQKLKEKEFDVVVTDVRMDEVDGIDVLDAVRRQCPRTKTILITGYATVEMAREALAKGAYDFIAKPFQPKDLRRLIEKATGDLEKETESRGP